MLMYDDDNVCRCCVMAHDVYAEKSVPTISECAQFMPKLCACLRLWACAISGVPVDRHARRQCVAICCCKTDEDDDADYDDAAI